MSKTITVKQLKTAFNKAPNAVKIEGLIFIQRGLSEYRRIATQGRPWRVGQSGGAIPRLSGNLREKHRTRIKGLEGSFGLNPSSVGYARYVHEGTHKMQARPWLNYAMQRGDTAVRKYYGVFMDKILKIIAT